MRTQNSISYFGSACRSRGKGLLVRAVLARSGALLRAGGRGLVEGTDALRHGGRRLCRSWLLTLADLVHWLPASVPELRDTISVLGWQASTTLRRSIALLVAWGGRADSRRLPRLPVALCGALAVAYVSALPRPSEPAFRVQTEPLAPRPETETESGASTPSEDPSLRSRTDEEGRFLVRVGLATDLARFELPCCRFAVRIEADGEVVASSSPVRMEPAGRIARPGVYRLQAAALRDESQARGLVERLEDLADAPADAVFDADVGLYRVRLGRWGSREEAETEKRRLASLGIQDTWIVHEGGGVSEPGFFVLEGKERRKVDGHWLVLTNEEGPEQGMRYGSRRYRGRLLLFLNDRGTMNLVNELPLEDYLRGVVPREMGPERYGEIEALKAQAVAARTYTLRNLGEFAAEGYDICATPRCQVYGGMDAEHPLSDRAIAETAGEVILYDGQPVDALYSSTCGGHTEDVHVVFPLKNEPYLEGVPCLEAGVEILQSTEGVTGSFAAQLMRRVLPPARSGTPEQAVAARFEHLALLAGLPVPRDRLASLEWREVQRFVASMFDLALDARLFVATEDLRYLLDDPPDGWSAEELRLASYFVKSGLQPVGAASASRIGELEVEEILLRLAELLRVVRVERVRFLALGKGRLLVRLGDETRELEIPAQLTTFRQRGGDAAAADLALVPGDRLDLYWHGYHLLAVVQEVDPDGVAYDRQSPRSSWTRFRSDRELVESVALRYPGLRFRSFEALERGVSGRVGKIRILAEGGRTVTVEGLAVRWTLDIPDTLFTAKRLRPKDGPPGWLFQGRGWGHGVGMCQIGAFGMAGRGHGHREILRHYYSKVEIGEASVHPAHGAP